MLGDESERKTTEYEDELENDVTKTSVTRFFKLKNFAEEDFIKAINQLHLSRGLIL